MEVTEFTAELSRDTNLNEDHEGHDGHDVTTSFLSFFVFVVNVVAFVSIRERFFVFVRPPFPSLLRL